MAGLVQARPGHPRPSTARPSVFARSALCHRRGCDTIVRPAVEGRRRAPPADGHVLRSRRLDRDVGVARPPRTSAASSGPSFHKPIARPGVRYHKMSANLEYAGWQLPVGLLTLAYIAPAIDRGSPLARVLLCGTIHPVINALATRTAVLRRERETHRKIVEFGVLLI
jgi:hypothetical protein